MTIRGIRSRAVDVPMRRPLGTASGRITSAPLVLVDLETEQGLVGRAYLFCYRRSATFGVRAILSDIGEMLRGTTVAPFDVEATLLRSFRLLGNSGIVAMALSAVDVACWDVLAQAADVPLVRLLGGVSRELPAYNSNGLGLNNSVEAAAEEALSPSCRRLRCDQDSVRVSDPSKRSRRLARGSRSSRFRYVDCVRLQSRVG